MIILNDKQINQKVKRLAFEIIEQNVKVDQIYLAGINKNGFAFAKLLKNELELIKRSKINIELISVLLDPSNPVKKEAELSIEQKLLKGKVVILVDDVANTGRTLFYACKPFMSILVKKLKIAVLIDRMHKSFPIKVAYTGMSLATTLSDNIVVDIKKKSNYSVIIE